MGEFIFCLLITKPSFVLIKKIVSLLVVASFTMITGKIKDSFTKITG